MVHINLLPVREIKRLAHARQQLFTFFAAFVGLLLLLGAVGFWQVSTAKQLAGDIDGLKQEKQKYTKIIAQIKQLEKDKALLENKINVIKKLKSSASLTVHVLDEVARKTPSKRIWLTTVSQSGNSLQLAGMALDNRTIAKYMDDLKSSPYIQDVDLANSSLKEFAGRNLKSFSLSCAITVPQEGKEAEKE